MTDPGWLNFGFIWRKTTIFSRTPAWKCKAYSTGEILGDACITYRRGCIWIEHVQTSPEHRRKGIGRALMNEIIANAPRKKRYIRLTIQPFDDDPMNRDQLRMFYSKLGFVGTRKRQAHYQIWELDTRKRVLAPRQVISYTKDNHV